MLHRGVFGGLEHVKLLLQRGTRINDRTLNVGRTALHQAINYVEPEIAIFLVQQGADFSVHTVNGVSAAWAVYVEIRDGQPTHPIHTQFLRLRDLMIEKGAKWPPDSPEHVRARGEMPTMAPRQTN